MGGTQTTQHQKILTDLTTNTEDYIQSSCTGSCGPTVTNTEIIVAGKQGNVSIVAKCNVNSNCMMTNQAITTVDSIVANALTQDSNTITGIFGGALIPVKVTNTTNIKTTIANNISQITESTCQASSSANISNTLVYVEPTGSQGNFTIDASSDVNATCTMNNLSKIQIQNSVNNSSNQTAKNKSLLAIIFMVLLVCVLVGGIILILLMATGVLKGAMGESGGPKEEGGAGVPGEKGGKGEGGKGGGGGGGLVEDVGEVAKVGEEVGKVGTKAAEFA